MRPVCSSWHNQAQGQGACEATCPDLEVPCTDRLLGAHPGDVMRKDPGHMLSHQGAMHVKAPHCAPWQDLVQVQGLRQATCQIPRALSIACRADCVKRACPLPPKCIAQVGTLLLTILSAVQSVSHNPPSSRRHTLAKCAMQSTRLSSAHPGETMRGARMGCGTTS